jgi:hypothetical protein
MDVTVKILRFDPAKDTAPIGNPYTWTCSPRTGCWTRLNEVKWKRDGSFLLSVGPAPTGSAGPTPCASTEKTAWRAKCWSKMWPR